MPSIFGKMCSSSSTKVPLNYPLLIGEEDGLAAAEAFGMGMAFPFSVFVDSQNRILTVKIGELHEDEANFAFDRLRDIDNGVLTREAAQAAVAEAFREMAAERAAQDRRRIRIRTNSAGSRQIDENRARCLPITVNSPPSRRGRSSTAVWRDSYYSTART